MRAPVPDSLRNTAQLERSIRNFETWIGDAVSGGMDIDFCVERRGNFLFIEGKPWQKGVVLNFGQHLTLLNLSKQPSTTVLLVGESTDKLYLAEMGEKQPIVTRKGRLTAFYWPKMFRETNVDGLRAYVQKWWEGNS